MNGRAPAHFLRAHQILGSKECKKLILSHNSLETIDGNAIYDPSVSKRFLLSEYAVENSMRRKKSFRRSCVFRDPFPQVEKGQPASKSAPFHHQREGHLPQDISHNEKIRR